MRDIIDLDATYGGGPNDEDIAKEEQREEEGDAAEEETDGEAAAKGNGEAAPKDEAEKEGKEGKEGEEDDEEEVSISLAAMEEALLPQVLDVFDQIAGIYGKLARVQDKRLTLLQKGEQVPTQVENKYQKLQAELFEQMKSVRFNNARIEQLVDQLYGLSRRLIGLEGKLLRLAERCGVKRDEFLKHYYTRELDPRWVSRVKRLTGKGWAKFGELYGDDVKGIRKDIYRIADETGLPISEFRRIVNTVKSASAKPARPRPRWSRPICAW